MIEVGHYILYQRNPPKRGDHFRLKLKAYNHYIKNAIKMGYIIKDFKSRSEKALLVTGVIIYRKEDESK